MASITKNIHMDGTCCIRGEVSASSGGDACVCTCRRASTGAAASEYAEGKEAQCAVFISVYERTFGVQPPAKPATVLDMSCGGVEIGTRQEHDTTGNIF